MTPPITIVERTTRVGVLGHLDELERLMREYCEFRDKVWQELDAPHSDSNGDITTRLTVSSFLHWLRQRQREPATIIEGEGDDS